MTAQSLHAGDKLLHLGSYQRVLTLWWSKDDGKVTIRLEGIADPITLTLTQEVTVQRHVKHIPKTRRT